MQHSFPERRQFSPSSYLPLPPKEQDQQPAPFLLQVFPLPVMTGCVMLHTAC
jgi:hypothetical protein